MSVATKTRIALISNAEGIASTVGKLYTALPTDTSADPTVTRALDTATRVNSSGTIETVVANKGRIDFGLGVNRCPNLLVERTRTNLFPYSENFADSSWGKIGGATVTANQIIAPDGTLTADMITEGTSVLIYYSTLIVAGTYTQSYFAKKGTSDIFGMYFSGGITATFNLTLGTILTQVGCTAQIQDFGNGWYRCTATATIGFDFYGGININSVDGSTFYVWGAQIETGVLASSYIPRLTASAVTANADVITKTGISALIPQTKGGLFFDGYLQAASLSDNVSRVMTVVYTDNANRITLYRYNNNLYVDWLVAGVGQVSWIVAITVPLRNKRIKTLITYELNNAKLYVNDILVATDTSVAIPATTSLSIGVDQNSIAQWDGLIKAVAVTDELTATEIDQLFQYVTYADMASEMLYVTA